MAYPLKRSGDKTPVCAKRISPAGRNRSRHRTQRWLVVKRLRRVSRSLLVGWA
jgi:hypothetical protein